jgi:NCS2 family nucleobase:cation symporter-2
MLAALKNTVARSVAALDSKSAPKSDSGGGPRAKPKHGHHYERKPIGLIYGRDDVPPRGTVAILGLQHAIESASKVTLPVGILVAIGADPRATETMIGVTLLFTGICTLLVCSRRQPFGFGHLTPVAIISSFVAPATLAAQSGGLKVLAGMTFITGMMVAILSRVLHRLRFMFPPEVVGLIAFMVGASQASLALSRFLGLNQGNTHPNPHYFTTAAVTLALLAGLTVWGKGVVRLFSSLITIAVGYLVARWMGFLSAEQWSRVSNASWVALPHVQLPGFEIRLDLLIPFVVLGLSAAMKAAGDLAVCEKISDSDWKRADLRRSRSALLTFGLGTMISSALGGFAVMSSSSNIGLAAATGAASRVIGYACGAVLIALAFFPKVVALIAIVPAPVAGAMFLLVVSYNLIAGMQIIMSRMMETRHTYIIGLSLLFGLSAEAVPEAYANLPSLLRPLFASGLTLATVMVLLLNGIFRLGTSRRQKIELEASPDSMDELCHFIEEFGAQWGARLEVVSRSVSAMIEFFESVVVNELSMGNIEVSAFFDEYNLDFAIRYRGQLLEIPTQRPRITLDSDPAEMLRLSGYMLSRLADSVKTKAAGGVSEIDIHFEH